MCIELAVLVGQRVTNHSASLLFETLTNAEALLDFSLASMKG
jgi:hypothetical protein